MSLPTRAKKFFVKESYAQKRKAAEERVAELRQEGKSDKEIAVIMSKVERYNGREIVKALRLRITTFAQYLKEGEQVMGEGLKNGSSADTSSLSSPEGNQPAEGGKISLSGFGEKAKALGSILETTSGLGQPMVQKILRRYESRNEVYDQNPGMLYMMLINAGVTWFRAQNIVTEFLFEVNPDPVVFGGPFGQGGSRENPSMLWNPWSSWGGRAKEEKEGVDDEEEEERKFERKLDKQFNRAMMVAVMNSMGGRGQQQGGFTGGFGGMMPFMGATFEPMLDKDGSILKDDSGNMVMRVSYSPFTMPEGKKNGENKEIVTILADALKSEKEAKATLTETFASKLADLSESQVKMLTDRINALESSDPLEYVTDVFSKLKDIGLGNQPQNTDVAKMNVDLKRWMHEQDSALRKWIFEQKQAIEDKKYAREQMKQFMNVGREAIQDLGKPVAEAFKEGYLKGTRGNGRNGKTPQTKYGEDVTKLSDDDLLKLQEEANKAERVVEDSKKKIISEINRRGLNV